MVLQINSKGHVATWQAYLIFYSRFCSLWNDFKKALFGRVWELKRQLHSPRTSKQYWKHDNVIVFHYFKSFGLNAVKNDGGLDGLWKVGTLVDARFCLNVEKRGYTRHWNATTSSTLILFSENNLTRSQMPTERTPRTKYDEDQRAAEHVNLPKSEKE